MVLILTLNVPTPDLQRPFPTLILKLCTTYGRTWWNQYTPYNFVVGGIKKKRFLVIKIQKTWNLHAGHKFTSTLKESYTDNSSSSCVCSTKAPVQRNFLMLYLQCDGDVLINKAETCQNRRWKWKWLKYLRINLISTFYYYHWVDTFAGGLLVP